MPYLPRPKREKARRHSERNPSGQQQIYHSRRWAEHSRYFRESASGCICAACAANGVLTDVTPGGRKGVTDHVIRIEDGGATFDERNLLALCRRHHDRKSGMEGKGKFSGIECETNQWGERIPTAAARRDVIETIK